MREDLSAIAIAVAVLLMLALLVCFFAMIALAIRRDFRQRFTRLREGLEHDAFTIVRQLFDR